MKRTLAFVLAALVSSACIAGNQSVMVNSGGVLTWPTNFISANGLKTTSETGSVASVACSGYVTNIGSASSVNVALTAAASNSLAKADAAYAWGNWATNATLMALVAGDYMTIAQASTQLWTIAQIPSLPYTKITNAPWLTSYTETDPKWTAASNLYPRSITVNGTNYAVSGGTVDLGTIAGGGAGDNLGNHTATTNLSMSGNEITEVDKIVLQGGSEIAGSGAPMGITQPSDLGITLRAGATPVDVTFYGASIDFGGAVLTNMQGVVVAESDPVWGAASNSVLSHVASTSNPHNVTAAQIGALTNYSETDPRWSAVSNTVTTQAGHGETAYGWGDHGTNGYLTSYTETDPTAVLTNGTRAIVSDNGVVRFGFATGSSYALQVQRAGAAEDAAASFWPAGGTSNVVTICGNGSAIQADGTVYAVSFVGSGAGISNIAYSATAGSASSGWPTTWPASAITNMPQAGATTLTGTNLALSGATYAYNATSTNRSTLSVSATAPRYVYALELYGTNAIDLAAGLSLRGTWTVAATNVVVVVPGTGTTWNVYGRGL